MNLLEMMMRHHLLARTLLFLGVLLFGSTWAHGQSRFRLADPIAVAGGGGGWNVTPAAGALTMSLPVAAVQGEIPIPLVFRLNASHAVQVNHLWKLVPAYAYTEEGIRYRTVEWVDQGQAYYDRPMYGAIHFGYITGGATYGAVPEVKTYVMEDGGLLRADDFVPFGNISSGSFDLAQKFGFTPKAASLVSVDPSGRVGVYTATATELGNWQNTVQACAPINYGTAPTQYTVLLDKSKARVYAFISSFNAWVPILWVDQFGHSVTFQWTQTTTGLAAGMLATHSVEAKNQRGKGVRLSWAEYQSTVTGEVDLARADFIGVSASSIFIKGYPGMASLRPNSMSAFQAASGIIKPDVAGPVFRPTNIQVGDVDVIAMPAWGSATPVKPAAPMQPPPVTASTMNWQFSYDANRASLVGATDPLGVQTSWSYGTHMFITPGDAGYGVNPNYQGGIWQVLIDNTHLLGVVQTDRTDAATATTHRQTWSRTLPDGGYQTEWKVTHRSWFPSKGTSGRYTEFNFAPVTSTREYANGALITAYLKASDGSILQSHTNTWVSSSVNGSISWLSGSKVTRPGEPDRTTAMEFVDDKNLQVKYSLYYVGGPAPRLASRVAYEYDAQWNLLDGNRVISTTASRYNLATLAVLPPPVVTKTDYDGYGFPMRMYRDGGTDGSHGQITALDPEGRPAYLQGYHLEGATSRPSPFHVEIGFDPVSGLPISKKTTYSDPDAATQESVLMESQGDFDSGGNPRLQTDARGIRTTLSYDLRGRLQAASTEGSAGVTYSYPDERTVSMTRNARTTTEHLDGFGRVLKRIGPDGSKIEFTYDRYGRMDSQKEFSSLGASRTSTFGYDELDRPTSRQSATGSGVTIAYSVESGSVGGLNDLAVVTTTVMGVNISSKELRDAFGQVVKQVSPTGEVTTASYDGAGNQTGITLTPPAGSAVMTPQARTFSYDGLGRLISKTEQETGTTSYHAFDALNRPTTIKEGVVNGQATRTRTLLFDGLGRVRRVSGGSESLSYVFAGPDIQSTVSTSGAESIVQSYQYWTDAAKGKRLKQESVNTIGMTPSFSPSILYDYDSLGRLFSVTYPFNSRVVTYGYDADDRIYEIKNGSQVVVSDVDFDEWGNRSKIQFASGANSVWTAKDSGLHLDNWTVKHATSTTLSGPRTYAYDSAERLTKAGEWNIGPDAAGRVLTANASAFGINTTHAHDAYGNNISHTASGAGVPQTMINFSLGAMPTNRMPSGNTGWLINEMGEATQIGKEIASSEGLALTWDGLGRLARAAATPNGVIQNYRYAASGMRVSILDTVQPSNNRRFAYTSGGLLLSEYSDGGLKRDVIYLGSEAIAEIDAAGNVYELHNDHLGTPRVITKGNGSSQASIVATQTFGPYGEYIPTQSSGDTPTTGYTGHARTDATGLIYMRGRYYSPSWHRFLNSDQGVDINQLNQYSYVGGSPLEAVDPTGMETYHRDANGDFWICYEDNFCVKLTAGATVEVIGDSVVQPGVPTTGFGSRDWLTLVPPGGNRVGGGTSATAPQTNKRDCVTRAEIIAEAKKWIGTPYGHGPQVPGACGQADCSGSVTAIYRGVGLSIQPGPTGGGAYRILNSPTLSIVKNPMPGDIVYWSGPFQHAMIYAGDGQVIGASSPGKLFGFRDEDSFGTTGSRRAGTFKRVAEPQYLRHPKICDE